MCKDQARGFSLTELMVVILIVSILAVVSGPIYRSYSTKSKFAEVFAQVAEYKDLLVDSYTQHDYFLDTIGTLTAGSYVALTSNVLQLVYYQNSTNADAAYLRFYTLDLGVDGYVAPDGSGAGGSKCRVTLAVVPTESGYIQAYCGQWDGGDEDVPLNYLPNSCQDTNISALIS